MKKLLLAFIAGACVAGAAAQAALIDFVAEAAGDERGVADGTVIAFDGINVTFTAGGAGSDFAYFDDLFEGRPAGLGVCTTLDGAPPSECLVAEDDSFQSGESVTLAFDGPLDLSDFSFSDGEHFSLNASASTLLINGIGFTFADVANLTAAVAAVVSGISSITFAFGGADPEEFYVNSFVATPLPAAAPLLLAGIAGLRFAARRRKAD